MNSAKGSAAPGWVYLGVVVWGGARYGRYLDTHGHETLVPVEGR